MAQTGKEYKKISEHLNLLTAKKGKEQCELCVLRLLFSLSNWNLLDLCCLCVFSNSEEVLLGSVTPKGPVLYCTRFFAHTAPEESKDGSRTTTTTVSAGSMPDWEMQEFKTSVSRSFD